MATVVVQARLCKQYRVEDVGTTTNGRCECGALWSGSRAAVRLALSQHTDSAEVVTWLQ